VSVRAFLSTARKMEESALQVTWMSQLACQISFALTKSHKWKEHFRKVSRVLFLDHANLSTTTTTFVSQLRPETQSQSWEEAREYFPISASVPISCVARMRLRGNTLRLDERHSAGPHRSSLNTIEELRPAALVSTFSQFLKVTSCAVADYQGFS
jgi:hypothetical protein